jgi:hypothetical protein
MDLKDIHINTVIRKAFEGLFTFSNIPSSDVVSVYSKKWNVAMSRYFTNESRCCHNCG